MNDNDHSGTGLRRDARGYSLLELLVSMLVSTLVVGGVMTMLTSIEEVHRDAQQLIDAQQQARISMDQMQRDLQQAGVGLAWLVAPLPLIVPQGAGSFEIRHNQGGLTTSLTADQAGTNGFLVVDDVTGFSIGMTIGVYDSTGAFDLVEVTGIDSGNDRISHDGTSKAFTVADGTAVAHIQRVTYAVDAQNRLTRQLDDDAAQPIAANVVNMTITYWNNASPTATFNPVTNAQMMRIQTIQIDLTIETDDPQLNTVNERQVTLSTQVTPRAIVLS